MLETLRRQPEHTRIIVTIVGAVLVTVAITAFWIWGVTGRFKSAQNDTPREARPLAMIGSIFKGASSDIKANRTARRNTTGVTVIETEQARPSGFILDQTYVGGEVDTSSFDEPYGGVTIYTE